MTFLSSPHLDLTTIRIETERCVLVPFTLDGTIDIHELTDEFCRANKNLYVSPFLPTYEQEVEYLNGQIESIKRGEIIEFFILEKDTSRFLGATGLTIVDGQTMNIGLWIRVDEHGKGYATEAYAGLLDWAREHVRYNYLKHSLNPDNTPSRKLALKFDGILQSEKTGSGHEIYHIPLR